MMKSRIWCVGIVLMLVVAGALVHAQEVEVPGTEAIPVMDVPDMQSAMVEVRVARVQSDQFYPWRQSEPRWHTGYAVAVEPGVFLTLEPLVRNHATILIRRAGSVQQVAARVQLVDPRVGLALLVAEDVALFADMAPRAWLERIPLDGDFTIVKWGENDQVQAGLGQLLSTGYESIGDGVPEQLTYQLVSSMHVGAPGTPVLHDGKLAGLATPFRAGGKTVFALSPDMISRFLADAESAPYAGVPEPDFEVMPLADPVRRRYLGVPPEMADRGVYVEAVLDDAADGHGLHAQDVLLRWDGEELDARGNYTHPRYGSIPFGQLLAKREAGDLVPATVVRDGAVQQVEVRLRTYEDVKHRIPENATEAPDDYVVAAGLVFRELTWNFLEAFGSRWQRRADIDLIWRAVNPTEADTEDEGVGRTVVLVQVLADPINKGYRDLRLRIVERVNGHTIRDLRDLATRITTEGLRHVTLADMEAVPLVFDPAEVAEADARIQQRFQIPTLTRFGE